MYNSVAAFSVVLICFYVTQKTKNFCPKMMFSTKYLLNSPYKNNFYHINIRFRSLPL